MHISMLKVITKDHPYVAQYTVTKTSTIHISHAWTRAHRVGLHSRESYIEYTAQESTQSTQPVKHTEYTAY